MAAAQEKRARIRELNDAVRFAGPRSDEAVLWVLTRGVRALGEDTVLSAIRAVQAFDRFTEENDPYGEHDFGSFEIAGQTLFWKIDYYDRPLEGGTPDPTDEAVTCRVLTILLAHEY
ncbi:MAG TPA: DUF3768 domain-containing protein [Caulobacteraceae bacterium]